VISAAQSSIRHARRILSGIHYFNDLEAGFPTKTVSGMTFSEIIKEAHPRRTCRLHFTSSPATIHGEFSLKESPWT
jgi:hypothetical protein